MIRRTEYLNQLLKWQNQKVIKVITGIRRCGKSTLLMLFQQELVARGVSASQCISVNFEDLQYEKLKDYHALYQYLLDRLIPDQMNYIFLDEIQMVSDYEKAVDSLFLRDNVDIYITGSNAYMLSGELATLLSGRYVEISILPLSFSEYYQSIGGDKRDAFSAFFRDGGFPYVTALADANGRRDYLQGIYSTVLLKDIVERKRVTDVPLLESIVRYLADNVGNIVSVKKIADSLTSDGRKTTVNTVDSYVQALKDAFILYEARRYDIKGKQHLRSLEKYYLVDMGLRSLMLGSQTRDVGRVLENIVFLELIRRGWRVSVGKLDTLEVDFVVERDGERQYYQVSASVLDEATYAREFTPLKRIPDHYPKFVLTMDELPMGDEGIKQQNIIEFLLEGSRTQ